jgi:hypothetical protein
LGVNAYITIFINLLCAITNAQHIIREPWIGLGPHVVHELKMSHEFPKIRLSQGSTDNLSPGSFTYNREDLPEISTKDNCLPTERKILPSHYITHAIVQCFHSLPLCHRRLIPNDERHLLQQLSSSTLFCEAASLFIIER